MEPDTIYNVFRLFNWWSVLICEAIERDVKTYEVGMAQLWKGHCARTI